jgi:superfamily I DNA and RNA helicase
MKYIADMCKKIYEIRMNKLTQNKEILANSKKGGPATYISETSDESYYDSDRDDSRQKVLYESLIEHVCELKAVKDTLM